MNFTKPYSQSNAAGRKPAGMIVSDGSCWFVDVLSLSSSHSFELIGGRHQSLLI